MAETLWVVCALRGHTTRPISDCCTQNRVKPWGRLAKFYQTAGQPHRDDATRALGSGAMARVRVRFGESLLGLLTEATE